MSSSQYIARLDIVGTTFYFSRFKCEGGWPATVPRKIEVEMRAMGTDYSRFREDGFVFDPWSVNTSESVSTQAQAITLRSNYLAVRRQVGQLLIIRDGQPYRLKHCKVADIAVAEPRAALTVGFGAGPNDQADVQARWTFQFTDTPT